MKSRADPHDACHATIMRESDVDCALCDTSRHLTVFLGPKETSKVFRDQVSAVLGCDWVRDAY